VRAPLGDDGFGGAARGDMEAHELLYRGASVAFAYSAQFLMNFRGKVDI
jgi:hypothetical protein